MPNCIDCKYACNPIINEQSIINIDIYHRKEKITVFYAPSSKFYICQSILCYNRAKYYNIK